MKQPPHDPNADVPFPPPAPVGRGEGQSKLASLTEALADTFLGLCIAFSAQMLIVWAHGLDHIVWTDIGILTFWMTVISLLRRYAIRRLWNSEFWKRWRNG